MKPRYGDCRTWNRIPDDERQQVVTEALAEPEMSPQYVVLKAKDEFDRKTRCVHEMWQTDFTYLKIVGWGWYYLLTMLDDFSRYIVAWKLYTTMDSGDVKDLLEQAIVETGAAGVRVRHRPRLLSDNGPCFVAKELQDYLAEHGMEHTRGRPYHPQTSTTDGSGRS